MRLNRPEFCRRLDKRLMLDNYHINPNRAISIFDNNRYKTIEEKDALDVLMNEIKNM